MRVQDATRVTGGSRALRLLGGCWSRGAVSPRERCTRQLASKGWTLKINVDPAGW